MAITSFVSGDGGEGEILQICVPSCGHYAAEGVCVVQCVCGVVWCVCVCVCSSSSSSSSSSSTVCVYVCV